ncbi:helix-turn-helix transcriptional regulator [Cohnella sp. JJ-181]|uniref:helix-turn-helix transcriptional regulator n=1 Tax=Cohnella rhizoplanae TaxID=2974897 RepID=UPI0022FF71D9|nr:AraC family transcriptional regulator [Cohnella sp. JJ-181]CAI6083235.1 HTH-type transcriptional activator RhaR [Cohnella sp. JJ-181]
MRNHLTLPLLDPNPFLLFPESAGRYMDEPDHRAERPADTFPYFNLHYVRAGEGLVEADGQWQPVYPGDAFLYFPNQPQKYRTSEDRPWDVYWMHFYGDRLPELLTEQGFRRSVVWSTREGEALEARLAQLVREIGDRKPLHPSALSTAAYGALAEFMAQAAPYRPRRGRDAQGVVRELLPAMQDAACEPFSLETWADKAGVTPHYFCKLFRKSTQMSPMDFITLCRLRHAKQQLMDDLRRPVGEIAGLCGYPSASYFIKRFKEKEGVTPAAYREMHAYRT